MGYYSNEDGLGLCYYCGTVETDTNTTGCDRCGFFVCIECHDQGCE